MNKRDVTKTIARIFFLVSCSIGIYRTNIEDMLTFITLMVVVFWVLPFVVSRVVDRKDVYDGEITIRTLDGGGEAYNLRIYNAVDIPKKDELLIKVNVKMDEVISEEEDSQKNIFL